MNSISNPDPALPFDADCRRCPRLVEHRAAIRQCYPDYHSAPVPAFGVARPKLLIVGLAPGLHGANRSGRPFTGDEAGRVLFNSLYQFGFSNRACSIAPNDGLELIGCRITNAVLCLPPKNKPLALEVNHCNPFLRTEIEALQRPGILLALGHLAHNAILKALTLPRKDFEFAHSRV
ncbi:MAG: uracil-DNA glycosylase family protein, partial [Methylococcales bacterium]